MAARATDGHVVVRPMAELAGRDWGQGWFRLNACSYCDDVVAETADVSVGDAWLPGWVDDSGGTNVAVARSDRMRALIEGGIADGSLALQPLSADDVARSQAGGLRYRRDALELRLADAQDAGRWVPRKRVKPARRIPRQRRKLLALREEMARFSREAGREARATGDFQPLFQHMRELAAQERQAAGPGPFQRLKRRLKRMLKPG
jgi:coenzyme F420-reducing hydrogenase beta subunit